MKLLLCIFSILGLCYQIKADYRIGIGIADCTGPPAGVTLMGYAKLGQKGNGLHLRQFSRAFIIEEENGNRIVFVSADIGMMGHGIRQKVLNSLEKMYPGYFTEDNVILSGTHTHGGPGGFLMDIIFDISCLGFVRETFDAIADGIIESIKRAHENMVAGKIYLTSGEVLDANINRSPTAYLLNPESERLQYKYDVDKEIVQLKFMSNANEPLGAINWFPVHPTSMNNTNHLVTSDNVGYASILFEKEMNNGALAGTGKFVAAFASSNLGDVSPNIKGARCIDTGFPCEKNSSTCNGDAKLCIASGPGDNMYESTRIIATRIKTKAFELFNDETAREITGPIKSIHQYINMPEQRIQYEYENGTIKEVRGCSPAMGYSFAAGTTDGPGEFDFMQGSTSGNEFWDMVRDFLGEPTEEDIECQAPKPILLATGRIKGPYQWQPEIVSTQIGIIGDVIIAAIPGEFTTMSGRRMKKQLKEIVMENGGSVNTKVIIAGLCNIYTDYIATPEEYQMQRYEAASTVYGPYTLPIYLNQYQELLLALIEGKSLERGKEPEDFSDKLISLVPPVILDLPEVDHSFGDCVQQPSKNVSIGDVVTVQFVAGHPRNNLRHGGTYLTVERLTPSNSWEVVATDAEWNTKFTWKKVFFASSRAIITWTVGSDVVPGTYRIRHFGTSKSFFDKTDYEGTSEIFNVH